MNPYADDARILALIRQSPKQAADLCDILESRDFHGTRAAEAFDFYQRAHKAGVSMLSDEMLDTFSERWPELCEGDAPIDDARISDLIRRFLEAASRRRTLETADRLHDLARDPLSAADEWRGVIADIGAAFDNRRVDGSLRTLSEIRETLVAEIIKAGTTPSCPWSLFALSGLRRYPGEITVIAGRPGHGKTALAVSDGYYTAARGIPTGIICCEMSEEDLLLRFACHRTGISFSAARDGRAASEDNKRLAAAFAELEKLPLFLRCGRSYSPAELRATASAWKQRGLKVLWIDHLLELRHDKGKDLRERVTNTCQAVKDIAQEFSVPIMLLTQLNRGAAGTRPAVAHLKETGAIEEKASAILLIHRPTEDPKPRVPYKDGLGNEADMKNKAAILNGKNRSGPRLPTALVGYEGVRFRFHDLPHDGVSAADAAFAAARNDEQEG